MTVRMTSFTDPPCAVRTDLKSARSAFTVANRRCTLFASLSSDRGAGFTVRRTSSSILPAVLSTFVATDRTSWAVNRTMSTISEGRVVRSATASTTRSMSLGAGLGIHG